MVVAPGCRIYSKGEMDSNCLLGFERSQMPPFDIKQKWGWGCQPESFVFSFSIEVIPRPAHNTIAIL